MADGVVQENSWQAVVKSWLEPKVIAMLFLGFSAGMPILLIFSTLSIWLIEAGVSKGTVTFFSWAALGYSFKFTWAPIVDMFPLPFLTSRLGRRRGWLLFAQCLVIISIICMASVDPSVCERFLTYMAFAAVMLGFSSATQDIVIDAYRIEIGDDSLQALLASMYIAGYRIGMLVAGAGSLFLADFLGTSDVAYNYGSWQLTYLSMAAVMSIGVITTFIIKEPEYSTTTQKYDYNVAEYIRFLILFVFAVFAFAVTFFHSGTLLSSSYTYFFGTMVGKSRIIGFCLEVMRFILALGMAISVGLTLVKIGLVGKEMVIRSYFNPVKDFFVRYGIKTAFLLLLLVGFYRLSDIVLGVVANLFYIDMGFSKTVIGGVTKSFGLGMTLAGGFLGGFLTLRYGVNKILFLGALLSAATNILFMLLAAAGPNVPMLAVVIAADNLSGGIATTAFIAFLSSMTNVSFTAVQYAIFTSIMTLFPKLIGGYSGTVVSNLGYPTFFLITALLGIPVLLLVLLIGYLLRER